jgi:hypothetical protein
LVRAKSIPETVSVTHVSSAFLLVTAVAGSDAPTVANSMKPQVVVRATRVCLIARIKRTTKYPLLDLIFSDDPREQEPAARRPTRNGLTAGEPRRDRAQIDVVFGQNLNILLSQLQPLLILSLVTRPVYPGGPSPFQGSWR